LEVERSNLLDTIFSSC